MGKPRLPWKRGPRAWEIARRSESILQELSTSRRGYYSLRRTARLFGVSTQPVRDWIRLGFVKRDGPRNQISGSELTRFLNTLIRRAKRYGRYNYVDRIERNRAIPSWPWRKLRTAQFIWPKEKPTLTPVELAHLIGCHPSLIIKAIYSERIKGCRRTPCRWAITRRAWNQAFYF